MSDNKRCALVLDGNTRQVLPIIKGLHNHGFEVTVICNSVLDEGYTSRYTDHKIIVKYDKTLSEVEKVTFKEIQSQKYDLLLPLTDETMEMVTRNFDVFNMYVRMPVPDRETFMKVYDKYNTMCICMDAGIPCPITKRLDENIDDFIKKVGFPLIAKPRSDSGSMGLKIVNNYVELNRLIETGVLRWDKYIIQEYIPLTGKQYNAHMFVDSEGAVKVSLMTEKCRWYPVDGGASCLSRSIIDEDIKNECEALMRAVSWKAYCDVDLIEDPRDGSIRVIEINGRASANIKICSLAGIDIVEEFINFADARPVRKMEPKLNDVRLRCILTDALWLLQSKERFTRKPSWFSIARTSDQIFSFDDPLPFFAFVISSVPKYRAEMKKRSRK